MTAIPPDGANWKNVCFLCGEVFRKCTFIRTYRTTVSGMCSCIPLSNIASPWKINVMLVINLVQFSTKDTCWVLAFPYICVKIVLIAKINIMRSTLLGMEWNSCALYGCRYWNSRYRRTRCGIHLLHMREFIIIFVVLYVNNSGDGWFHAHANPFNFNEIQEMR